MRNNWRALTVTAFVAATLFAGSVAKADDAADAKKAVENFVAAWQTGDAKAMRATLVIAAAKEKDLTTVLDSVAAVVRLQKAALDKFGAAANEHFSNNKEQFEARLKKIKDGTIKPAGESFALTIARDEATKTLGGTLIIVKHEGTWKISGSSLFDLSPTFVACAAKLTAVADQIAKEIAQNKYTTAVDAYHEFNTRYAAALKDLEPATQPAK